MTTRIGPESLPQFEDRLLCRLVELTGDRPISLGQGVSEADLAVYFTDELQVDPEYVRSAEFHGSDARGAILSAIQSLEDEGLLDALKIAGPWTIRPTREGRKRVLQWQEEWVRRQKDGDRLIQRRVLSELDRQRRADPERYQITSLLDVEELCSQLRVDRREYLAVVSQMEAEGLIGVYSIDQVTLSDGHAFIEARGVKWLESQEDAEKPRRDAQQAWVEVARLKRQLQIAERNPHSLIADEQLRRRCTDLLAAEGDYDRVVREACVVLEDRVRVTIGADHGLIGVNLMEHAFGRNGPLQLSSNEQEQTGALNFYRGTMAFFRNAAGHRLIDSYTQEDVLRFVAWVDLLLKMVATASAKADQSGQPSLG